jgi:uncharacterized protein with PhoU and TrkA domain
MRNKPDELEERLTELEKQIRKHGAEATRRLDDVENAIRHLAEDASEETRRKIGRLGLLLPGKPA